MTEQENKSTTPPSTPKVDEMEARRIAGKRAARQMLLAKTKQVRLTRDCPTSKGRLCRGSVVRLPVREADALVKARPPAAKEVNA
jgi:hypothetical protein